MSGARNGRRLLAALAAALACACARSSTAAPTAAGAPDIVLILADDLGWADVGYHGSDASGTIRTPEIDALARSGLRLERFRTAPLCTPSRAGLLTGRSPLRAGLLKNIDAGKGGLPLDEELLPSAFARAGYRTAMVGKWHLGHARPEQWPNARGFESFYGFHGGLIDYATHLRNGQPDWWRNDEPLVEAGYATHLFADEAVKILSERGRSRPLFLYVAFNAPHPPVHLPPGTSLDPGSPVDPSRAAYGRMVEELDRAVGRIRRAVADGDRAQATIVFFASDNGAGPKSSGSNAPLREGKFTVFEGGIRTPAVLWWPPRVPAGSSDLLVTHLDVLPTLAGLAGIRLDPARPLDGVDLSPALAGGGEVAREPVAFGCESGEERRFALVDGRWKLAEILSARAPPWSALFDLEADPGEQKDLSAAEPERVARMRAQLEPWERKP